MDSVKRLFLSSYWKVFFSLFCFVVYCFYFCFCFFYFNNILFCFEFVLTCHFTQLNECINTIRWHRENVVCHLAYVWLWHRERERERWNEFWGYHKSCTNLVWNYKRKIYLSKVVLCSVHQHRAITPSLKRKRDMTHWIFVCNITHTHAQIKH